MRANYSERTKSVPQRVLIALDAIVEPFCEDQLLRKGLIEQIAEILATELKRSDA